MEITYLINIGLYRNTWKGRLEHTPEKLRRSHHDFRKTNLLSINYLQTSFEASKKELQQSFHDINHWTTSYNQEAVFLSENLQQVNIFQFILRIT